MDPFFPFIYEKRQKKTEEQLPLYLELDPPPPPQQQPEIEEETPRVIIIEL
jgi:hypothetical protein